MRRTDREVTDAAEIFAMLNGCDSMSLGMVDDGLPYVIPMTFGCEQKDGKIIVYIHSAKAGRKWDILMKDPSVCVEGHLYYRVEKSEGGITARYESVIGTGKAELVTEQAEKVAAFKIMLAHYNNTGFPVTSCKGLPNCEVFRIELNEVCGKRN